MFYKDKQENRSFTLFHVNDNDTREKCSLSDSAARTDLATCQIGIVVKTSPRGFVCNTRKRLPESAG